MARTIKRSASRVRGRVHRRKKSVAQYKVDAVDSVIGLGNVSGEKGNPDRARASSIMWEPTCLASKREGALREENPGRGS